MWEHAIKLLREKAVTLSHEGRRDCQHAALFLEAKGENVQTQVIRAEGEGYQRGYEEGHAQGFKYGGSVRRESDLAVARRVIREVGPPPPGDGTHPLQGHRDSMG
jgi:flagellar biosynthesis/type III secretory pathway protein FliH